MGILAAFKQLTLGEQRTKLRQFLLDHFNDSEIDDLCFDLGINEEDLGVQGRKDKIRELIRYCERHLLIDNLITALHQSRPQRWSETFGGTTPAPVPAVAQEEMRIALRERIETLKRRLYVLQEQEALFGPRTSPEITIEIESLQGKRDKDNNFVRTSDGKIFREGEIARLERELKELGGQPL